jgi:molecular chaperone DnaJ
VQPDEICRVLGVAPDADAETVKRAYRAIAVKNHPDRNAHDKYAAQKFTEASAAYAAWSAKHVPAEAPGSARSTPRPQGAPFNGVEDIFGQFQDLFGEFFGKRGARGGDLAQPLKLSYVDARDGTLRTVELARRVRCEACKATPGEPCSRCTGTGNIQHQQGFFKIQTVCPDCKGVTRIITKPCGACENGLVRKSATIDVTVPPDMKAGMRLRIPNKGDEHPSGPPGHLYLEVVIDNTSTLIRDGDDVTFETEVPSRRAILGGKLDVDTLDGPAAIEVPRFVRDGAVVTLAGRGYARAAIASHDPYREIARGDQRVILRLSRATQLHREKVVLGAVAVFAAVVIALFALLH